MLKYFYSSLTAICLLVFISGCFKNTDVFTEYFEIETFYQESLDNHNSISFTINSSLSLDLGNIKISIPDNGLVNQNGDIFSGTVDLKYSHLDKVGDYIKYGLTTSTENGLLESYSIVYLEFSNNGELLYPNKNNTEQISIYIPSFDSIQDLKKYLLTDNGWSEIAVTSGDIMKANYETETGGQFSGYKISISDFGWLSFSEELKNNDGEFTMCIDLSDNHNEVNSVVVGTLVENRTVIKFEFNQELSLFCGKYRGVIKDQSTTIVSISNQGEEDRYAFGTNYAILNNNEELKATLTVNSFEDVCRELEKL